MPARSKFILVALSVLVLTISTGCVSTDAPQDLLNTGDSWAIALKNKKIHASPPYQVSSITTILRDNANSTEWTEKQLMRKSDTISNACIHHLWCLKIQGTPSVASAWKDWVEQASKICTAQTLTACHAISWRRAFELLFSTSALLLGHKPLPLHIQIFLIPEGDGFHARMKSPKLPWVKLQFGFTFPVDHQMPGFNHQVKHALENAISIVAYEFQHVEDGAGQTAGPMNPPGAWATKNEANSECWRLSYQVLWQNIDNRALKFSRETGQVWRLTQKIIGKKRDFKEAAVVGPAYLRHDLARYLVSHYPTVAQGSDEIKLTRNDINARRALLRYCRAFAKYPANFIGKAFMIHLQK